MFWPIGVIDAHEGEGELERGEEGAKKLVLQMQKKTQKYWTPAPYPKALPKTIILNPYPESLPWNLTLNPYLL